MNEKLEFMEIKFEKEIERKIFIEGFYYALMMQKALDGDISCNN